MGQMVGAQHVRYSRAARPKPKDIEVYEGHTARKEGDGIGQACLHGPFACHLETQSRDGANIALHGMREERVGYRWLVGAIRVFWCHARTLCWSCHDGGGVNGRPWPSACTAS